MSERFEVVPLAALIERIRAGQPQESLVALSFDDGYADNLMEALPVLRRFGLPATIFVATGPVFSRANDSGGKSWNDYFCWRLPRARRELRMEITSRRARKLRGRGRGRGRVLASAQRRPRCLMVGGSGEKPLHWRHSLGLVACSALMRTATEAERGVLALEQVREVFDSDSGSLPAGPACR